MWERAKNWTMFQNYRKLKSGNVWLANQISLPKKDEEEFLFKMVAMTIYIYTSLSLSLSLSLWIYIYIYIYKYKLLNRRWFRTQGGMKRKDMKEFFKSRDMVPISIGRFFFEIYLKIALRTSQKPFLVFLEKIFNL